MRLAPLPAGVDDRRFDSHRGSEMRAAGGAATAAFLWFAGHRGSSSLRLRWSGARGQW